MAGDITLEQYEHWVHPADALERAKQRFGQRSAIRHLWDALGDGRLHAVAETRKDGTFSGYTERFVFISAVYWRGVRQQGPESFFWLSADLTVPASPSTYSMSVIEYHGVRFNPRQLEKLLAPEKPAQPASDKAQSEDGSEDVEHADSGPPVERPALEAWHRLYTDLYPDESLPHAVASAKGFFWDKTVGRDRVHALFPARKSGRKSRKPNK